MFGYGFGRGFGRGFGLGRGLGRGMGRGLGNPYPFCRFNPSLPRRWWAMPQYQDKLDNINYSGENELEYLKDTANLMQNELQNVKSRINELEQDK